ncbi:hypothetical protein [Phenylobacterium sp.]|uniref:hypothetical protein n=1 Tax=Phenylobacterium sp. TaxID=1871053 RepID=UPI0025EB4A7E|nr:hypothetical protein [Phenylobacterium sp.]MBX3484627.1 hypothetical protein [Phenylobacterium sp.]MCW5759180.1 hypothetical protein [Phenylobacterium sp.]
MMRAAWGVLALCASLAATPALALSAADWTGTWRGPRGVMQISDFDGALVIAGAGARAEWTQGTESLIWDFDMACTEKTLSKDGSKLMLRTVGCINAQFNGKVAICTHGGTQIVCVGPFGERVFTR